jgi:polysaccharide deacetylase 2 family uncharacterized protein YibQ
LSFLSKILRRKKAPPPEQPAADAEAAEIEDVQEEPAKRRRFRIPLPPLPRFLKLPRLPLPSLPRPSGPVVGALVVIAAVSGLAAWLKLHGDETISRRVVQVPRVLVSLDGRPIADEEEKPDAAKPAQADATAAQEEGKPASGGPQVSLPAMTAPHTQTAAAPPPPPRGPSPSKPGPPIQLKKAPEPGLFEEGDKGPLPKIAEDGRQAWKVYARPFDENDKRPRIAIVISDLGLSSAATETAIQRLPGTVTLAFAPYGPRIAELVEQARAAGHETLMVAPSEPPDLPRNDPGPYTLLASLSTADNLERLETVLSRVPGYVGIVTTNQGRFFANEEALQPVLTMLRRRGLLYVDGRGAARSVAQQLAGAVGLPRAYGNRFLDTEASRGAIDNRLADLERIAREAGIAVGIGQPYPVTIERVAQWAETLDGKGLALAPITAVVDKQPQ